MTKFNWLLLRAIKKKICAQTIRKPIRIQKSSCKNVGVAQKKKTIIDDKIRPMKLFINRSINGLLIYKENKNYCDLINLCNNSNKKTLIISYFIFH